MSVMRWTGWLACAAVAVSCLSGCGTSYRWRSDVSPDMRTVSVPTFRNESNVTGLGSAMTRQLLREFQREGTFSLAAVGDSAVEVQGVVKSASSASQTYDRRSGLRVSGYEMTARVEISVIDKRTRKVLVDNRVYAVTTTFTAEQDLSTAMRDASGRLADDLARQVVDDVLNLKELGGENE